MNVKLKSTTNENFNYVIGASGKLEIGYIFLFTYKSRWLKSSTIKEVIFSEDEILIKTRNSEYIFSKN